jgi:hypothetical protein
MKTRFSIILSIVACTVLAFGSSALADVVYTFDNLTAGSALAGQDSWVLSAGYTGTTSVTAGTGSDKYVTNGSSVASVTSRNNDSGWSFGSISGTSVTLYADVQIGMTGMFGLGYKSSPTTPLPTLGATAGPMFGYDSTGFCMRAAGYGTKTSYASSSQDNSGDRVTVKLEMDLAANGGDGYGILSKKNLTDGDPSFTQLGAGLGLGLLGKNAPSTWNCMIVKLDATSGLMDNLGVGQPTPEPSTTALSVIGIISLVAYAWRKRRA